jgi:DNA phosphorothioation-associated putative methyltransferase
MTGVGKRVGDELYVHLSSVEHLADAAHRSLIQDAIALLPKDARADVNVAKVNVRSTRVSLLEYTEFDEDPFPALAKSWSRMSNGSALALRSYADSLNPPILHRKELLVHPGHPGRQQWSDLTAIAEVLGFFDEPQTIGFQMNWERLIASKGYRLVGEHFVPLGNVLDEIRSADAPTVAQPVKRHLTALVRSAMSAPVQLLLRHGLLSRERSFFDYGCGRGDDVAALVAEGVRAAGWDPYYAADQPRRAADVVNLGFVVNVIEDPAERVEVLRRAYDLTRGVMSVGVMLYGPEAPGRPFGDGFITSRGTFQKYFNQAEFKDYLEHVLHQEAFLVGPGVALVFVDKDWEQRFVVGRYRRKDVSTRLLATRARRIAAPASARKAARRTVIPATPVEPHPVLQALWHRSLDLGRFPEEAEIDALPRVIEAFGSLPRALRRLKAEFDRSVLEQARTARSDDLRLYFAIQQFGKRTLYRQLEGRLQRDIRAFFGDYVSAQHEGLQLLTEAADPLSVLRACQQSAVKGLGWLDGDRTLQLHASLIDRLPPVLRAFISCGLLLYGDLSDVDLIKIHIGTGKLSLMQFDDFATSPMPSMSKRVKINVRRADYDVFEYGNQHPKPLLYHKSRYLNEEADGYAEQLAFDEALDATGVLGDSEFGPSAEALAGALRLRRLEVEGMRLRRSTAIPDLDEPCGARFRYRQLIECGVRISDHRDRPFRHRDRRIRERDRRFR